MVNLILKKNYPSGNHGGLTGLGDDDHTQYILVDGIRAFTGNQSLGNNDLTNVDDIALSTISSAAGTSITVNLGTDAGDDFIVGNNNALVVEGDNDRVGIGTNAPTQLFHVNGISNLDGAVVINESGADVDFRVEGDTHANLLVTSAADVGNITGGQVFIGANASSAPGFEYKFEVWNDFDQVARFVTTRNSNDVGVFEQYWNKGTANVADEDFITMIFRGDSDTTEGAMRSAITNVMEDVTHATRKTAFAFLTINGNTLSEKVRYTGAGLVGINVTNPDAMLEIVTNASTEEGLKIKGSASQSGSLLNLTDNSDAIYITTGDGLTGSEFRGNDQNVDIDFVWEGNTDTELFHIDAGLNGVCIGCTAPASLFEVDGAEGLAIETVTGNTTLDKTHSTVLVNASGNVTITLPTTASSYNNTDGIGRIYEIKKIDADANTITINGDGSETIDGAETAVITTQWESITIQSNGTSWFII